MPPTRVLWLSQVLGLWLPLAQVLGRFPVALLIRDETASA